MKTDAAPPEKIRVVAAGDTFPYGYVTREAGRSHFLAISTAGSDHLERSGRLRGRCVGGAATAETAIQMLSDHWSRRTGRTLTLAPATARTTTT